MRIAGQPELCIELCRPSGEAACPHIRECVRSLDTDLEIEGADSRVGAHRTNIILVTDYMRNLVSAPAAIVNRLPDEIPQVPIPATRSSRRDQTQRAGRVSA